MLILLFMLILSEYIYSWLAKTKELFVSAVSVGVSYDVTIAYGWYSDDSVFSMPRRLFETRRIFGTRRLIEVLRYLVHTF